MLAQLIAVALLVGPHPQATGEVLPSDILEGLSTLALAPEDTYRVRDLTLRRDVISVSFERGILAFLEPVNGRVTGAVFVGTGDVLALPPDDVERRQLNRFTGSPILTERFNAAVIRFTDDTHQEVLDRIRSRPSEEVRADDLEALLPWGDNLGATSELLNFRLLQDLAGSPDRPVFFAALRGERLGWFDVAYDERSVEEVIMGDSIVRPGQSPRHNVWASFNKQAQARDLRLYGTESAADVDVSRYRLDVHIAEDGGLSASAGVSVVASRSGERVLTFKLARALRLSAVRVGGAPVAFFQHEATGVDSDGGSMDTIAVVLPRPSVEGEELQLDFEYAGQGLERRGNGVYYISERIFWYPRGWQLDPAVYEMTFHFPYDNVLVATGQLVEEWESDGLRHSRWASGTEFVVAGFNYGDFSIESDETGEVPIYVHVNNDVETVYEDLAIRRAVITERALRAVQGAWNRRGLPRGRVSVQPDFDLFSTRRLASNVVTQVRSMVDFFSSTLGDYPFERLSVSQFPVPFSQGWPSLLYVSTLSFFDDEQRARLGLSGAVELDLERVLAHEIAHQWFGNRVSWLSYRDQWIAEGFSNYMAILYLEHAAGGESASAAGLARLKGRLLARSAAGETHDDSGPVWIGQRLATALTPDGYTETIYPKATWIVHMLRMLTRDPLERSDAGFHSMIRDYLSEFDGRPASTWDLKHVAERHMTSRMDLDGSGTLDWFFDQWVLGTGVPEYALEYAVVERSPEHFEVSGRIGDNQRLGFVMPLPVYARTSGEMRYIQDVVVSGNEETFSFELDYRPEEILMDPYDTVLRR